MLDIGSGRGQALAAARELGWEARGVEPSASLCREAAASLGVTVDHGTVAGRYADGSFGLILLASVLEHTYDPMDVLRECRRLLAPGGLLYLDVPNERSLLHRVARPLLRLSGRDWTLSLSPTFPPFHVVGFSPRSLRLALERAELEVIRSRAYPLPSGTGGRIGFHLERALAPLRLSGGMLTWARAASSSR